MRKYGTEICLLIGILLITLSTIVVGEENSGVESSGYPEVEISASAGVISLVESWGTEVWIFTPENDPIKSLIGLEKKDVACSGLEHKARYLDFLDAARIERHSDGVLLLGGTPIFKETKPPRVYISWSSHASHLSGGARVVFVEESQEGEP